MNPPTDISSETQNLQAFPRPNVAVDVAVLSVVSLENRLRLVALATLRGAGHNEGKWALPGRMLREHDTLENTAQDAVRLKLGITKLKLTQLQVFDAPDRDPRGWVLSVAHVATVPQHIAQDALSTSQVDLIVIRNNDFVFPNSQRDLPYEQREILTTAVANLRRRYLERPDPGKFLPKEFTLRDLRHVHEAVHGKKLQPDTFRRDMLPHLRETGKVEEGTVGRPARVFTT